MKRLFLIVWVVLAAGPLARAEDLTSGEGRLFKDLKYLASDECEGRGITTKGINLAAEYVARQFQNAGLHPAGPDGTFYQHFPLITDISVGKGTQLVLNGPLGQSITVEPEHGYRLAALSSAGRAEAPLVFAGYGIASTEPAYDDYAGLDVAGKVVVALLGGPRNGHRFVDPFAGKEDANNPDASPRSIHTKARNAHQRKAAALLLLHSRQTAALLGDLLPRPPSRAILDAPTYPLPVIHIGRDQAERLFSAARQSLVEVEQNIDAALKPHSRLLPGWTCRLDAQITQTRTAVKNVVGVLEGDGPRAQETIVIGAHYDHDGLGRRLPITQGVSFPGAPGGVGFPLVEHGKTAIHYGADDNASGTVAVIELARRFGRLSNRQGRRLVFIAFSAEESGLLGSAYYCRQPIFPLDATTTMVNLDMVGRLQDGKLRLIGADTAKGFRSLIERHNQKHRLQLTVEGTGEGASDHASFYRYKVPVLSWFTGFHEQYHQPSDRLETLNINGIRRVVDLVADLVEELRTAEKRPEFTQNKLPWDRLGTLWASAPSVGIHADPGGTADGVIVRDVVNGTPAAKAGVKKGDRVVAVASKPVPDLAAYLAATRTLQPGATLSLALVRDGQRQDVTLELVPMPAVARIGLVPDFSDTTGGVLVSLVRDGSPAGRAGLRAGDRVTAINGKPVVGPREYVQLLGSIRPDTRVEVSVLREGQTETVQVALE